MKNSISKEMAKAELLSHTINTSNINISSTDKMPLFSIIIPAYNSEMYLSECLDSVELQQFDEDKYEVIIVNDGSTDNTEKIALSKSKNNSNIKYIKQANQGLSGARNTGIQYAKGEYILFLDADDAFVSDLVLDIINRNIENEFPDFLQFKIRKVSNILFQHQTQDNVQIHSNSSYDLNIKRKGNVTLLHPSGCNKVIRKKLIQDNKAYFEIGVTSEDIAWSAKVFSLANTVCFLDEELYAYRQHKGSISKTITPKSCVNLVHALEQSALITENAKETKKSILEKYMAYQIGTFFLVQAMSNQNPIQAIERAERLTPYLLLNAFGWKLKILSQMCKIMGFRNTCSMIRRIYQSKSNKYMIV